MPAWCHQNARSCQYIASTTSAPLVASLGHTPVWVCQHKFRSYNRLTRAYPCLRIPCCAAAEILEGVLPASFHSRLAYLSGPSFAAEVARELPTVVTIAAKVCAGTAFQPQPPVGESTQLLLLTRLISRLMQYKYLCPIVAAGSSTQVCQIGHRHAACCLFPCRTRVLQHVCRRCYPPPGSGATAPLM